MPPKKAKDLAGAPVYRMGHEEQVQLLSDALLREYMHRRGFRATLKAFDEEHPRDDNTISSRAVMSDLMALQADDQQRMKGEGIETIMEMLCNLRVERRVEAEALTAEAEAPLPKVPAKFAALEVRLQERAARAAAKTKSRKVKSTPTSTSSSTEVAGGNGHHAAKSKKTKKHAPPPPPATTRVVSDMTIDDLLGGAHGSGSSSDGADSDDERENKAGRHGTSKQATSPQDKSAAASGGPKGGGSPAARPAWMELEERKAHGGKGGGDGSSDDDDDGRSGGSVDDSDDDGAGAAASGDLLSAGLQDELSAAFQLLCGFDGGLPRAFTEQGFAFDDSLDCNLIQWKPGGLDAVVAPLQALVAAYYYEREVYVRPEQRQQDCLLRALSTSLEQAQPNPAKVVLVNGLWTLKKGAARLTRSELRRQANTPRVRCWTQLSSYEDVRDVLRDQLLTDTHWRKSKGCGLVNYVFSLILSRGVDVVRKELSAATASDERPSLLSSSSSSAPDCASFALANLVLAGRATPFRHNGVQDGNRVGYPGKLKCGMLVADTLGDPATASSLPLSAYTHSLEPLFPSWVLRHKGHYANLYMTKDTRQVFQQKLNLGGSASENVVYWDAATEDDVYTLSLTVRSVSLGSLGGRGPRNAKSFVRAAITSVPVWSSAEVNWNDDAPLRDE